MRINKYKDIVAGTLCVLLAVTRCSSNVVAGKVLCPQLQITNGKIIGKTSFLPGSTAKFECDPGYDRLGHATIMCQDDGSWSDNPPFCQKIVCGKLPQLNNGHIIPEGPVLPGNKAAIVCNNGYILQGPSILECDRNGTWEPYEMVYCKEISSPQPSTPHNGYDQQNSSYTGDSAGSDRVYNDLGLSSVAQGILLLVAVIVGAVISNLCIIPLVKKCFQGRHNPNDTIAGIRLNNTQVDLESGEESEDGHDKS